MAIVITGQPEQYNLAYNDNVWCFYESTLLTPSRRFIINVIDASNTTSIGRFIVFPSIDANGGTANAFFDPSRILQTRLQSCIAIPSANHAGYVDCNSLGFKYAISIESEDKDANGVYQRVSLGISEVKTVWNGGATQLLWLSFDWNNYDVDTSTGNRFLTNAPSVQYINDNQSAFLYMLGSNPISSKVIRVEGYTENNVLIGTAQLSYTASGNFNYVPVGTYDLENADPANWTVDPATVLVGAAYYKVFEAGTEQITFHLNKRCSKYTPIRLHWLNGLGGFDSFNFNMKSIIETDIDRRSYQQNPHTFTGNFYRYQTYDRGVTDYHVGTQQKLTVNTPFLTEVESGWMQSFASSPVIYQEVNNQLIAISGKVKTIDFQTSLNNKLMQYTFELDYSLNDMRQRG